ncbi:hypothetical protein M0R45_020509 [Rubus argutus]|uniref:Uncharacterized protein n=1 Tax=Rubus argutus TaxID=59490 RepID=A0AAW1X8L1_RUBAR
MRVSGHDSSGGGEAPRCAWHDGSGRQLDDCGGAGIDKLSWNLWIVRQRQVVGSCGCCGYLGSTVGLKAGSEAVRERRRELEGKTGLR